VTCAHRLGWSQPSLTYRVLGFIREEHENLALQLVKSRVVKGACVRLGCGHIGKGDEEGAYTLIPFTISLFRLLPRAVALHSKCPTHET
jgi:hypothetical protein